MACQSKPEAEPDPTTDSLMESHPALSTYIHNCLGSPARGGREVALAWSSAHSAKHDTNRSSAPRVIPLNHHECRASEPLPAPTAHTASRSRLPSP